MASAGLASRESSPNMVALLPSGNDRHEPERSAQTDLVQGFTSFTAHSVPDMRQPVA